MFGLLAFLVSATLLVLVAAITAICITRRIVKRPVPMRPEDALDSVLKSKELRELIQAEKRAPPPEPSVCSLGSTRSWPSTNREAPELLHLDYEDGGGDDVDEEASTTPVHDAAHAARTRKDHASPVMRPNMHPDHAACLEAMACHEVTAKRFNPSTTPPTPPHAFNSSSNNPSADEASITISPPGGDATAAPSPPLLPSTTKPSSSNFRSPRISLLGYGDKEHEPRDVARLRMRIAEEHGRRAGLAGNDAATPAVRSPPPRARAAIGSSRHFARPIKLLEPSTTESERAVRAAAARSAAQIASAEAAAVEHRQVVESYAHVASAQSAASYAQARGGPARAPMRVQTPEERRLLRASGRRRSPSAWAATKESPPRARLSSTKAQHELPAKEEPGARPDPLDLRLGRMLERADGLRL